jgi:predicted nucleic acid-binding protein
VTLLVADASVAVKWALREREEHDADAALDMLAGVRDGSVQLLEPPHWFAEVAAVIVRLRPTVAKQAVGLLRALDFDVAEDLETYELACDLAMRLRHHLFDTLYHAVALRFGAELVTADLSYYRKARSLGSIRRLSEIPGVRTSRKGKP